MPSLIDLSGQRFGRLVVKRRGPNLGNRVSWIVECDCGRVKTVRRGALNSGATVSCGCYAREFAGNATHGMTKTKEYSTWLNMKARCLNPNTAQFADYGGRGITVCKDWIGSFDAFYTHVGAAPTPDHSIDRINNDGDYEPGNVRWATRLEQAQNKRPQRLKPRCRAGHDNWHQLPDGQRRCQTCNTLARRRYVAKRKLSA